MAIIFDLPPEVLEAIIVEMDPIDVSAFSQTCRTLHGLVYDPSDQTLWRNLYLAQPFDDPRACVDPLGRSLSNFDWRKNLQRIIRARTVVRRDLECSPQDRLSILQTLLDLACNTPPLSDPDSDNLSLNHVWLVALLRDSAFLDQMELPWTPSEEERQLRAKLHTYYGVTRPDYEFDRRVETRARVYAMRNYRAINDYGPFIKDGSRRVDWEQVLAIHHVISMHFLSQATVVSAQYAIFQLSMPFCQPVIPPGLDLDATQDWAGVEGFWRCSFCFCDHRDLLDYNNYGGPDFLPLDTDLFRASDFAEVFSGANMHCRVVSFEHDPAHPTRPIIHFVGGSEEQSYVKGWVRLTSEQYIRWHFETGQPGDYVWSSEGIQVGSVRSSYGVLGVWTTVQHELGDPVGPFLLRKMPHITAADL